MKEVLKTYKERLINLNGRNRSLVLKKIYKKRSFDLKRLMVEACLEEVGLINFLLKREKSSMVLMEDPFKLRVKLLKELEKEIQKDKEEELEALKKTITTMEPLSEEEAKVVSKRETEIESKYSLLIEDEKKNIEKKIEKIIGYFNQINYLAREIDAVEKETGKYELFIGYPFVEGTFNDGTFVRGPLVLFPVEVEKKNNQWLISNILDQDIMINKVLAFGYAKYNEIKLEDFETEFSSLEDFGEAPIEGIIKYVNDHKLVTNVPESLALVDFKDYTAETTPAYKAGELFIKPYMILGQFPLSNSIYTDYQTMEEEEEEHELLASLLLNQEELALIQKMDKEQRHDKGVTSEHDTFFFTQLDYSQENAVNQLSSSNKLVIYGPPGTGKSHTIANIISDGLCKDHRILMVSQKRAALDVIYNRLSDLKSKMVLIHDANKDKKEFYQKVSESVEEKALLFDLNTRIIRDEIATKIDDRVVGLEHIAETLMTIQPFGLSLQEMYVKTQGIFEAQDPRFSFYKRLRKNNPFLNDTYSTLSASLEKIKADEGLIENFSDYRLMVDDNPLMLGFRHRMDIMSYDEVLESVGQLNQLIDANKGWDMKAYEAFATYLVANKTTFSSEGMKEAAKAYNDALNHQLLNESEGEKWQLSDTFKKLTHMKEIKEQRKAYAAEEDKYVALFEGFYEVNQSAMKVLEKLKEDLTESHYDYLVSEFIAHFDIGTTLNQLVNALDKQSELLPLKTQTQGLTSLEAKILHYAYNESEGKEDFRTFLNYLLELIILDQISLIEKSEDFNEFYLYFNQYIESVDEITSQMEAKNSMTKDIATSKWNDKFQVFVDTASFKEFKRQAEKKRQLWPIRKYITEFSEMLLTLFPCWLLSPETVSDIFPLKKEMFDIIIFDEASQIFVENAIPTIFRGKSVVIAGDDKQLQPSSTFMSKYDDFEEEETTLENVAALEEESLLDLAKVNYDAVHLNYHYRSRYEELINFSNYAFYGGNLNISPNIQHTKALPHPPIERIKVEGIWEKRRNNIEANRVVDLVAELLATRTHEETIGIITFNITQKDLIEDLLEARMQYDETFKNNYLKESSRYDGNEDVSIFVKNIENVQGDERDIIIFSVGYAKNPDGKVLVNFGSLSQDGGENRLNVAISRAKRKVYVVTSIEPEELRVNDTLNMGPKLFRDYLIYSKAVSDRDEEGIKRCLSNLSTINGSQVVEEDEFVTKVSQALRARGHEVMVNIGSSESKIDLAILHPVTKEFVLGIECDGKTYRSIPSVRERDIHRKRFLESRGWEVIRIWSIDWWKAPSVVLDKIEHFLEILLATEIKPSVSSDISNDQVTGTTEALPLPEDGVGYGDKVMIRDQMTQEMFDVSMDGSPLKSAPLNPFKQVLLGKTLDALITYEGYEYQVVSIKKGK